MVGTEQKVQLGPQAHSFETQALLLEMLLANVRDIGSTVGSAFHPNPTDLSENSVKICTFCFISKPKREKKEQDETCLFQLYYGVREKQRD